MDGFVFKRKRKAEHLEELPLEAEATPPAVPEEKQVTEQSRVEPATSNPASNQEILQAVWGLEPDSAKQHAASLLATIPADQDPQQALPALAERLATVSFNFTDFVITVQPSPRMPTLPTLHP